MPQTTIVVSKGDILLAWPVFKASETNLLWSMSWQQWFVTQHSSACVRACVCILISLSITVVRKDKIYLLTLMNIYKQIYNEYFTKEELLIFLLIKNRNNLALWMFFDMLIQGKVNAVGLILPLRTKPVGGISESHWAKKLLKWCHITSNTNESDNRPNSDLTEGSGSKGKVARLILVLHSLVVTREVGEENWLLLCLSP